MTSNLGARAGRVVRNPLAWVILIALGILPLVFFSFNKEITSDPEFTLLVSQALLEHGSIRLDPYQDQLLFDRPFQFYINDATLLETNGHYYNYYPAGPSILSTVFVLPALLRGWDMATADNYTLQYILSALSVAVVFLLVYALARAYLDGWSSLAIAVVAVLGSSFTSSLGTALWSLNFTTIFLLLVLLLFVRWETGGNINGYLVGLLMFLAFFCRASAVAFIIPALLYLLWRDRPVFFRAALTAFAFFVLFLVFSRWAYGTWLPAYYTVARVQVDRPVPVWVGILGHFISPSRGVLVFSPFLVLVLLGVIRFWRTLARQPLFWLCLSWFAFHVWLASRATRWWGGWSFGPRVLTDAFPALVLITILLWHVAAPQLSRPARRLSAGTFLALGVVAIFVHVGQGLYNKPAQSWNALLQPLPQPGETGLGELFDWQYAQVLMSSDRLCAWEWEKVEAYLPYDMTLTPLPLDRPVTYLADQALLVPYLFIPAGPADGKAVAAGNDAILTGWGPPTDEYRWSGCHTSRIVFRPGDEFQEPSRLVLAITAGSLDEQPVTVRVNGTPIGSLTWNDKPWETGFRTQELTLDSALIQPGRINTLTFEFPEAHMPGVTWYNMRFHLDQRSVALALHELVFRPDD